MYKIAILKAYAQNYPILKAREMVSKRPIGIICNSYEEAISVIAYLSWKPLIVDNSTSVELAKKYLVNSNSEAVVLFPTLSDGRMPRSKKMDDKVVAFVNAAGLNTVNGNISETATFFVFIKSIPEQYRNIVYPIYIEKIKVPEWINDDLVPYDNELPLVYDIAEKYSNNKINENWMFASIACMYPMLKENFIQEFEQMVADAKKISESAELLRDSKGTALLILSCIRIYLQENTDFEVRCLDEPDIKFDNETLQRCIYIDSDNMYLHNSLYEKIVTKLVAYISADDSKACLLQEGILVADKGGYTSKMNIQTSGMVNRIRMLKLSMKRIKEIDKNFCYEIDADN